MELGTVQPRGRQQRRAAASAVQASWLDQLETRFRNESALTVEQIENVDTDNLELIFGREFKLEAADPYLFFAYKFRHLSLEDEANRCAGLRFW